MKDSPEKISPLRRRMIEDMRMRKLSTKTQDTYIRAVRHFAGYLGRSPDTARDEDLRRYQLHCVDRGVSPITLNATITGLKFFFEVTLKRPELMGKMSHVRVVRNLAGGFEPRGGEPPDRERQHPQASHRPVGGVWRGSARERSVCVEGRRHR